MKNEDGVEGKGCFKAGNRKAETGKALK